MIFPIIKENTQESPKTENEQVSNHICQDTVNIVKKELDRMQEYVNLQSQSTTIEIPQFKFSNTFINEVQKYSKVKKGKKLKTKSPYDKPAGYTKGMNNYVAFTSHLLPYCEGTTNKSFRNILWDIYKGVVNTWFEKNEVSKDKSKELGKEQYVCHLLKIAPKFKEDFPNILSKLTLFDPTLDSDQQRVKVIEKHVSEKEMVSACVGAANASAF
jgi:hypothetical protein